MKLRRSRVLIDARLLAYQHGGIARYVRALTEWLPQVEPRLAYARVINRKTSPSTLPDLRVRTPPHFRFERLTLGAEYSFRRAALIHSPDFIAPAMMGGHRVVTVHDLAFLQNSALLSGAAQRYYGQIHRSLRVTDRVIAVSAYTARQLLEFTQVASEKITVIHNGVDQGPASIVGDSGFTILERELGMETASRILERRPLILAVGTIEPRKRHQLLLKAVARFRADGGHLDPLLILVGRPGWQCDEIVADIERQSHTGNVIWLQNASDETVGALYRTATLLALPSIDEGFGLPLLEAMSAGLPVVAARRGALPEVADDAAILLDSDDPEEWARTFRRLVEDEALRCSLSALGRSRAAQFTWEQTANQTAAVYREVLGI